MAAFVAAALAAAGCGGGGDDAAAPTAKTAGTTKTAAAQPARVRSADAPADPATAAAVRAVGERYLRAVIARDYATACATRIPSERRALANAGGGSCADALRRGLRGRDTARIADPHVTEVRRRGSFALASWTGGGHTLTGDDAMVAQRVGGLWLLVGRSPRTIEVHPPLTRATARAVRAVTNRYFRAMAARDWAAACATRTPTDRRQMADFSGAGCEDALMVLARNLTDVKTMRAGKVRMDTPDKATVAVDETVDGETFSVESQTARRVGGQWLLEDAGGGYSLP